MLPSQLLVIFGSLWHSLSCRCTASISAFIASVILPAFLSSHGHLIRTTLILDWGPPRSYMTSSELFTSAITLFPNRSIFWDMGIKTWTYIFGGNTIQSITKPLHSSIYNNVQRLKEPGLLPYLFIYFEKYTSPGASGPHIEDFLKHLVDKTNIIRICLNQSLWGEWDYYY